MYLMIDSDSLAVPDGQRSLLPLDLHSRVVAVGEPAGIFPDGWVQARAAFEFLALDSITSMSLEIWSPPHPEPLALTVALAGEPTVTLNAPAGGVAVLGYTLHAAPGTQFTVELISDRERQLSATDLRRASYILRCIGLH
jgi:hypothetical protein